jgi:hypothetical protein
MTSTTRWVRRTCAAAVAALVAVTGFAALALVVGPAAPARADTIPFTDPNATGLIGFCDQSGHAVTSGKLRDAPFVWTAVSNTKAPDGYASPKGRATLLAFQPIQYVDPGDWSGKQLTAASQFTNSAHPMSQATALDPPMLSFTGAYPPRWGGLVQIRMYFSAPDQPQSTSTYPAAVLRISGDSWTVVEGGNADCSAGKATSIESVALPSKAFAHATPTNGSTSSGAPGKSGSTKPAGRSTSTAASGTSGSAAASAASAALTGDKKKSASGGLGSAAIWITLLAVAALALGAEVIRRRRGRTASGDDA